MLHSLKHTYMYIGIHIYIYIYIYTGKPQCHTFQGNNQKLPKLETNNSKKQLPKPTTQLREDLLDFVSGLLGLLGNRDQDRSERSNLPRPELISGVCFRAYVEGRPASCSRLTWGQMTQHHHQKHDQEYDQLRGTGVRVAPVCRFTAVAVTAVAVSCSRRRCCNEMSPR